MNPDRLSINEEVLRLVPKETCLKYTLVPLDRIENSLLVAVSNPGDTFALDDVKFMTGLNVVPVVASEASILAAIENIPDDSPPGNEDLLGDPDAPIDRPPAVTIVERTLLDAIELDASHVHFEPSATGLHVRFRIDGVMREMECLPGDVVAETTSRLKIMAKLDIGEKRLPQDGRVVLRLNGGQSKTFTIVTLPTVHGERLLLHLKTELRKVAMTDLGFPPAALDRLKRAVDLPSGLVLVAGPPRSGRSTTLYAIVDYLNTGTRCILTAEDPPDLLLEGVGQTVIKASIGYTYGAAVRALAGNDPDVIMISGIPDAEAAAAVLSAASSGVTVLSSLESNGAPQALLALVSLGCPPALLASAVRCVLAQRLMRRLCDHCKADSPASSEELARLAASGIDVPRGARFQQAPGCPACRHTGYNGRLPIGELLTCSDAVKAALVKGVSAQALREVAISEGMLTFTGEAIDAALAGRTTVGECLRLIAEAEAS